MRERGEEEAEGDSEGDGGGERNAIQVIISLDANVVSIAWQISKHVQAVAVQPILSLK